jgi:hypothetical protein
VSARRPTLFETLVSAFFQQCQQTLFRGAEAMPAPIRIKHGSIHVAWATAIVLWSSGIVAVLWWITDYEFFTNETTAQVAVDEWPHDAAIGLSSSRPTLVFFMHPKCPCTRASLTQLRKLLEASAIVEAELPDVIVVVSQPQGADSDWSNTDTVRDAAILPRATIFTDVEGLTAEQFGAVTSGAVMLFDTSGKRLYAGGITVSRGHEGDSAGGDLLRQLLKRETPTDIPIVPTFGCKLCTQGEIAAATACTENCTDSLP